MTKKFASTIKFSCCFSDDERSDSLNNNFQIKRTAIPTFTGISFYLVKKCEAMDNTSFFWANFGIF